MPTSSVDLYNNVYSDFASSAEATVRQETYGKDLGQSSWLTAREWLEFAAQLGIGPRAEVLEVGSGSGGPAVYLAVARGCRVTGVDINEHGVRNARVLAETRGVADRVHFQAVDASQVLPFASECFDSVVSNDAMCHIRDRAAVLHDWYRVLRPGGRALFTDAMVVTGIVSQEELATRSSIGFYLFVPPGENERLLESAGFAVLSVQDVTDNAADVSGRWREARARHREALVAREGQANFDGLQRFLTCVHTLSVERRLSRYAYLAEKPARRPVVTVQVDVPCSSPCPHTA
jgi:SAM-dependent methyltransferase